MSSIINNYPVFEDNQVLTASQLNSLSDYLDQQTRLTRTRLIGSGIGCGLEISYDDTTGNISVTTTKGVGVTSEGYLIDSPECTLTKYRVYNNPAYTPFDNVLGPKAERDPNDPRMWELLPADATPAANDVDFNDDPQFLIGKVIVFFLECVDLDNKACLGNACDEIGMTRTFTLRKLALYKDDLEMMLSILKDSDGCPAIDGGIFAGKYNTSDILLKRPLFDPTLPESEQYLAWSKVYRDLIDSGVIDNLFADLSTSYTIFQPILEPLYGENPFTTSLDPKRLALREYVSDTGSADGFNLFGIQYMYDAMKDIVKALNEFRDASFSLISQCCSNSNCFPKHLVLGDATSTGDSCQRSPLRTHWISSAMTNNQQALLRNVLTLHKRLVLMVEQLNIKTINNPNSTAFPVKITPSCEKKAALDKREIPFYFDIAVEGVYDIGTLEQNWDPRDTRQCKDASAITKLSYHRNQMALGDSSTYTTKSSRSLSVNNPLQFDLDNYNFLRMGAAHNKPYNGDNNVTDAINNYRDEFNLPFKVLNLSLVQDDVDGLLELCNFSDLNSMFIIYREELKRQILLAAYKTQPGDIYVTSDGRDIFKRQQSAEGESSDPLLQSILFDTDYDADFKISGAAHGMPLTISQTYGRDYASVFIFDNKVGEVGLQTLMVNFKNAAVRLYESINVEFKEFEFGISSEKGNQLVAGKFMQLFVDTMDQAMLLKAGLDEKITRRSEEAQTGQLIKPLGVMINIFTEMQRAIDDFVSSSMIQKFATLYALYRYRLTYLQENDPRVFKNFLAKNRGIKHGAGVPFGGTYILLHTGETVDKPANSKSPIQQLAANTVIGDYYLNGVCCDESQCIDIPLPTTEELNIPLIAVPIYVKYNPNTVDLISVDASGTVTCNINDTLELDVEPLITYDRTRYERQNIVLQILDSTGAVINDGMLYRQEFPVSPAYTDIIPGAARVNESIDFVKGAPVPSSRHQTFFAQARVCPTTSVTFEFDYKFLIVDAVDNTILQTSNISTVTVTIFNYYREAEGDINRGTPPAS